MQATPSTQGLIITDSTQKVSGSLASPGLVVIQRAEHGISRQQISPGSLKVLYSLNDAGYQAYIVGGGVRDILLGLKPKDFDIATDATPEQIKAVFRSSRIIGRRFRIVHVHFGREIIEVSTFRALTTGDNVEVVSGLTRRDTHIDAAQSAEGMILRDNVYGTIDEDVLRRDFTVNALYYTVKGFVVHDYVNGMADIAARCLRMIGDAEQRYREDPVRILRALRLAAKLGFSIAPDTAAPISRCARLLESIPSARLFDEFLKLFFAGHGAKTYQLLRHYKVFDVLFPASAAALSSDSSGQLNRLLTSALVSTDERINAEKSVTPAFLLAALLWPALQEQQRLLLAEGTPPLEAMNEAAHIVLMDQLERLSIPKRFSIPMREIWDQQLRLPNRRGKRAELMLANKRFRASYDFLLLREASGEDLDGLGQWWTDYQNADAEARLAMQNELEGGAGPRSKSRRRRPKPRREQQPQATNDS
jgi:poly(A) polymerase